MKLFKRTIALSCAAVVCFSSLCGCAKSNKIIEDNNNQTNDVNTNAPVSESTSEEQKFVPKFTVAHSDNNDKNTAAPPSAPASPSDTMPQPSSTGSAAPVESHEVTAASEVTNSNGEIVDDYRSDLVLDTEDPDALYEKFGLSRQERKSYYQSISQSCSLPIIHISTENEKEVLSRDDYIYCLVEVMNCEDEYIKDAVSARIRVRGNASAHYGDEDLIRKEGAPYRIKFLQKQSMLGLNDNARCKSWVLLMTYDTGVRDHLAFELARTINEGKYYASDSRFVQLYINEEYKGLYLLCEQSQENPNRVAINECEEGYTGTDIGYLVELDNYSYEEKWRFMLIYNNESITDYSGTSRVPKKYYYTVRNDIYSDEQLKFIERYFEVAYEIPMRAIKYGEYYRLNDDFTLTPAQNEFSSAIECVSQVLDLDSFVDMYITYEIVNDQDVGGGSFFFAVDFGNVSQYKTLTCVSPWDFSWAYTDYNAKSDGGLYAAKFKDSYFVDNWGDRSNPWLILLYSADWFQDLVRQKWQQKYQAILTSIDDVRNTVNTYSSDFTKDNSGRASRARTTLDWVEDRVKYLNTLWG